MRTSKFYLLMCLFFLTGSIAKAQLTEIFSGQNLPPAEGWSELKLDETVNPAAGQVLQSIAGGALKLVSANASGQYTQLGWYKLNPAFNPIVGYTIEIMVKVNLASKGEAFNIQGFDKTGLGFRLGIYADYLAESTNPLAPVNVLAANLNNSDGFHTYRLAVTPSGRVNVYRDNVYTATFNLSTFYHDNLIANGGFEDETVDLSDSGWTVSGGVWQTSSDNVHGGSKSAYAESNATGGRPVYRPVPLKPGVNYDFSAWGKTIARPSEGWRDCNLWLNEINGADGNIRKIMSGVMDDTRSWKNFTSGFSGTRGITQAIVELWANGTGVINKSAFDDFLLTEKLPQSVIPSGAVNLFLNGDFEDTTDYVTGCDANDCPDWNPVWGARVRLMDKIQPDNGETGPYWSRSGRYALRYFNCGSYKATEYGVDINKNAWDKRGYNTNLNYSQDLPIDKTYTFSFWYHFARWDGDKLRLLIKNGDNVLWSEDIDNRRFPNWINQAVTFTTTAENHALKIQTERINDAPGLIYLDDLFLFEGQALTPVATESYLFFGKSAGVEPADVEIKSVSCDLTGAYAPGGNQTTAPELCFHYAFDGTLNDLSGNHYALTSPNGHAFAEGKHSRALKLNGVDQYLDLDTENILNPNTTPFSFCTWIYSDAASTVDNEPTGYEEIIFAQKDGSSDNAGRTYLFTRTNTSDNRFCNFLGNTDNLAGNQTFRRGQWIHIGLVCDPESRSLTYYINGRKDTAIVVANAFEATGGGFRIGGHKNGKDYWTGKIDELYLFKGLLSQEDINKIMNDQYLALDNAGGWQMKEAPVMTVWSKDIRPDNLFNEYPRPQFVRDRWVNLNGVWDFTKKNTNVIGVYDASELYNRKILVPFPIESAISGIMDSDYGNKNKSYIYRRSFVLSDSDRGKQILLHFGAVDWRCVVFVNGTQVGLHEGGYDPFSFDITDALHASGEQELVVQIYDPTSGGQPHGKQQTDPEGIWYTPSSGIWQTVWYEAVDTVHIRDLAIVPDVDNRAVKITVEAENAEGASVDVTVLDGTTPIASQTIVIGTESSIAINNPKLWTPDTPFLYHLTFELKKGDEVKDRVSSYFGMRKIALGKLRGKPFMFLNNKPVFHYGTLDQGFWPDGLYTPPSYEALRFDLEKTKELGFNMVRKHIKVEPARWYYYCDSLGLIVWQDMPNPVEGVGLQAGSGLSNDDWSKQNFYRETTNIISGLKNYPSILVWVAYNEGWGQFSAGGRDPQHTRNGVNLIRELDGSRLINQSSGWDNFELGDIIDRHYYSEPNLYDNPFNVRASVCGETGGYGYAIPGHLWNGANNPYGNVRDAEDFAQHLEYMNRIAMQRTLKGINGIVYTQITDVEEEVNGFYTYDRKISKLDDGQKARFRAGIEAVKAKALYYIMPTAIESDGNVWKYITGGRNYTVAAGWNTDMNYNDDRWQEGVAGFGAGDPPGSKVRTAWSNQTIYLRKKVFIENNFSEPELANLKLMIHHDEDFKVYINGVLAASQTGFAAEYQAFDILPAAKAAIRPGEENLIAVQCIQTAGGQYIDLGIAMEIDIDRDITAVVPEPKPFVEIGTPEQFNAIRNDKNGFYKLIADIDLSEYPDFEPIGTPTGPFKGYLFGNRHKVTNLNIGQAEEDYRGLFGYAEEAYFTDLEVKGADVNGRNNVGTLLGKGLGVTVERVVITDPVISGERNVGSICGGTDAGKASFIKDCYVVNGNVTTRAYQAGGLLGVAKDTRIENSYYSGKVTAPTGTAGNNAGGILGMTENAAIYFIGVASLAESVRGGTAVQFVPRDFQPIEISNTFARNNMQLSSFASFDHGLGRATGDQLKPLADFKTRSLYESVMGWDFETVWGMPADGFPVFQYKLGELGIKSATENKNTTVHSSNKLIVINVINPAAVWIYDAAGALVSRFDVQKEAAMELPQGVYIVKSVSGGKTEAIKINN